MPKEKSSPPGDKASAGRPRATFTIAGRVQQERGEEVPRDLKLLAFVFDPGGRLLGTGDVDARGNFKADVRLAEPSAVEIVVAPPGDPEEIRRSPAQRHQVAAKDWAADRTGFLLKPTLELRADLIQIFRPLNICVSGHVRKVFQRDGATQLCPVARAKVEVFDVDRESCWWPYLLPRLDRIADLRVLRAADLVGGRPPGPIKIPQRTSVEGAQLRQAELAPAPVDTANLRVGEIKTLEPAIASRLENLTLTSLIAPWIYFPTCFYSRALVCETFTDCNGFFNCCFPWWIFHLRRGRLRFDTRPDIIVRVTQVINGVETVIYMDPYTSTRWNVTHAHIDLYLDNDEVVCGSCAGDPLPGTARASLLQIGSEPVYLADQADGRYKTPPISNGAFGGALYLRGNFTPDLLTGSPMRYYKLSWAPAGSSSFTPILTPLSALRSAPGGTFETHLLGPQPAGGPLAGLYEVQDINHWWLMPGTPGGSGMVLGLWDTSFETDQGAYTLRMEVYD
ncbi:MAG TPA: hypothetical protein VMW27_22225, partial [Thermoanaerobaculia bacterium]|nr:hypothetical protein [Thermoanaerobaculia bacterium]